MKQQEICLDQIDLNDRTFQFSYVRSLATLEQSIRQVGLVNPVTLQEKADAKSYRIVSGLRRILALKNLGYTRIPARIYLTDETDDFTLFQLHLSENASIRNFNDVERAEIIDKLINQFKLPARQVTREYLTLIGLGTNPKVIERYLPLVQLPEDIKEALANEVIGVEMAREIGRLDTIEQTFFFNLCLRLKLGKNRQREFLHLFQDLSRMYDCPLAAVAEKIELEKILSDDTVPTPVQTDRVRTGLKRLRYPQLTKTEENFRIILKKFKLPPKMILTPYPFFEEAQFSLKFEFRNRDDLEKKIAALQRMADNPAFIELDQLT